MWNDGAEVGGGGGVDLADGARGAMDGGGGGAVGGTGVVAAEGSGGRCADEGGGGGAEGGEGALAGGIEGAAVEGFRDAIGGGGGFDKLGGTGGARGGVTSAEDWARERKSGVDLCPGLGGAFRRLATNGFDGCGGDDSEVGRPGRRALNRGAVGGFGADDVGGFGAVLREISGSERYEDDLSAPVSTPPPVFLNFGIPPANIPPS